MTTQDFLLRHIAESWLGGNSAGLHADTPLLELNIISSSEVFDLVHSIQSAFGIAIPLPEIRPENFRSVDVIADLIERCRDKQRGPR
ncbi:acyl carrier protein [Nocardia sp. 2]|uniref:Acyl carrier protein n=1 Tax=Nocardia acididurans TaxID=2802282 RepID=A0ABS1M5S4_9NOCA|nr:acyl carrier protein [Nocardia acididurans]MBL1075901.1 acyl carrier protein [Nocardia acididurans]